MDVSPAVASTKAALRSQALGRRDGIDPEVRKELSAMIAARAIAIVDDVRPPLLAAYFAARSECDPAAIVTWAAANGIGVAMPAVVDAETIVFRRYRPDDPLIAGGFGTLAPAKEAPVIDPDLVISPLVAFDRTGLRLGHGRGFYDRAIEALRGRGREPLLVGVSFCVQEVDSIPAEPHDRRLDWIVTENETLDCRRKG